MSVEDKYGPPPPGMVRPEHRDFEMLVEIVQGLDAEARQAGKDFDFDAYVNRFIDCQSLSYMALQRASRVFGFDSPLQVMENLDLLMRAASIYIEGASVGIQYEQRRQDEMTR